MLLYGLLHYFIEKIMTDQRNYSLFDHVCLGMDHALRAIFDNPKTTDRPYPAAKAPEIALSEKERRHSAALMRINHAGEVAAQALYHGQGLASQNSVTKQTMRQAAIEEGDHLAWCRTRLLELESHTSYLNPVWYLGSFAIGLAAGLIGDQWSLGFLAETESQVVHHLEKHSKLLSAKDQRSQSILQQMQLDEAAHRDTALQAGAMVLPWVVQTLMSWTSKVMVKTAYYI